MLAGDSVEFSIILVNQKHRGRQYDLPTAGGIGGLLVGDFIVDSAGKDIVLEYVVKAAEDQRFTPSVHELEVFLTLDDYDEWIPYQDTTNSKIKRGHMTMREYYAHHQTSPTEGMNMIKSGRLLYQYIVDAYTATKQDILQLIRHNQKTEI